METGIPLTVPGWVAGWAELARALVCKRGRIWLLRGKEQSLENWVLCPPPPARGSCRARAARARPQHALERSPVSGTWVVASPQNVYG